MKILNIRLDDQDIERIKKLQKTPYGSNTINGTIRDALKYSERYIDIMQRLNKVFKQSWIIDEKEFNKLTEKHHIFDRDPIFDTQCTFNIQAQGHPK